MPSFKIEITNQIVDENLEHSGPQTVNVRNAQKSSSSKANVGVLVDGSATNSSIHIKPEYRDATTQQHNVQTGFGAANTNSLKNLLQSAHRQSADGVSRLSNANVTDGETQGNLVMSSGRMIHSYIQDFSSMEYKKDKPSLVIGRQGYMIPRAG